AIVLRALAKNPAERYPSGAALSTALRHWDMPPPASPTYRDEPPRSSPTRESTPPIPPRMRTAPPPAPRNQPRPNRRSASGPPRQRTGRMQVVPPTVPPVRGAGGT